MHYIIQKFWIQNICMNELYLYSNASQYFILSSIKRSTKFLFYNGSFNVFQIELLALKDKVRQQKKQIKENDLKSKRKMVQSVMSYLRSNSKTADLQNESNRNVSIVARARNNSAFVGFNRYNLHH